VAFAAATGVMPLDMPESVLVRFKGQMQPGVTLRDLVHAIPLYAIKAGLLTVAKQGKKNIFSGRILEIEGLPDMKVEQAFELSDASAERSAAGCTVRLNKAPMIEYINSQHRAAEEHDRPGLRRRTHHRPPHPGHGSLAGQARSCWHPMPTPNTPP
jgi:aconitase B